MMKIPEMEEKTPNVDSCYQHMTSRMYIPQTGESVRGTSEHTGSCPAGLDTTECRDDYRPPSIKCLASMFCVEKSNLAFPFLDCWSLLHYFELSFLQSF